MNLALRDLLPGLRRIVATVILAVSAVGIYPGLTLLGQRPSPSSRVPEAAARAAGVEARRLPPKIELWAPDAFDGTGRSTGEYCVRYRVDATVLFPLFSIPLAHREDVGFASAMVRDTNADASSRVRAYELFATSFPERARGLNRMGFIREAVGSWPCRHSMDRAFWRALIESGTESPRGPARRRREPSAVYGHGRVHRRRAFCQYRSPARARGVVVVPGGVLRHADPSLARHRAGWQGCGPGPRARCPEWSRSGFSAFSSAAYK